MQISKLMIYKDKGKKGIQVKEMNLVEGKGIEGDRFAKGGEKQISITDKKLLNAIEKNPDKFGLCAGKIKSNIITENCRIAGLRTGDRLLIGDAEIEVTEDLRNCSEDCPMVKEGAPCQIKYGIVFAKVIKDGKISENENIKIKMKDQ